MSGAVDEFDGPAPKSDASRISDTPARYGTGIDHLSLLLSGGPYHEIGKDER